MEPGACGVALFFTTAPMWILMALLCGFAITLMITSKADASVHAHPSRKHTHRAEIERAGVALPPAFCSPGALYVLHADDIPRSIVLVTVLLVTSPR